MELSNKIEQMLINTNSVTDKKILENFLEEIKSGKLITEEEILVSLKTNKDLFSQIRDREMEESKSMASKLMENWNSSKYSNKTSGSYSDGKEKELNESSMDSKFLKMGREDLVNFIFDGEVDDEVLSKYTEDELVEIAIEKNSKIMEKESIEANKTRRSEYNPLGVTSTISKLSKSPIYEHSSFKIMISKYDNLIKIQKFPESIIVENFVQELESYKWDETVNAERNLLIKNLNENLADVEVEKAVFSIKRNAGWKFYSEAADVMNEWLKTENKSNKTLVKDLKMWSFNPVVGNLVNKLNEMESVKTGSLNIPSQQGESSVNNVYSPIFLSENNTYFSLNGKYFKGNSKGLSTISEEILDENFKNLTKTFLNENVRVNEKGISYYIGKEKVSIVSENDVNCLYVNSTKLTFNNKNTLAKLLESNFAGMFGTNVSKTVHNIITLYENFDNIVELDFIKSVRSRIHEGAEVNLIKWEDKIYVNKVNPIMNENSLYPSNGRQAVKFVKEYLNYDISEGLTEYLDVEDKTKAIMINDRTKVLENIKTVENEIAKINSAISKDSRLEKSKEIQHAKSILESDINKLKEKWSAINSEITKIDTIDFEAIESITEDEKFSIGALVKVKESGDTGKVISIDGSGGKYTVLHDNGQTGDYTLEEISDIEAISSQTPGEGSDEELDTEEKE